jgi:two-component system CheB/CheR fusion protein
MQELEAFSEELQRANEEAVSSNEELQTINEELETSKEEIESAREELNAYHQELQTRNELLNESYIYSEAVLLTVPLPLLILDASLRVKSANRAFYKKFKVTEEATEGVRIYDLGNSQWNIPRLRELLENIIPQNTVFENFEVEHTFEEIGTKVMLLNAKRIQIGGEQLILLAIADITELKYMALEKERALKNEMLQSMEAEKKMANLFHFIADAMPQKVWTADAKGQRNYFNRQWVVYTGMSLKELANEGWQRIIHPDDLPNTIRVWKQSLKTGTVFEVEDRKRDRNGQYKWHLSRAVPYKIIREGHHVDRHEYGNGKPEKEIS